eukprot:Gregarina_sp_Poly_1__9918@NODE_650_length_6954_cov_20_000436_g494_i0_p5_GENE_NODE_650_length_6954_cov_20_000436_g494_i0NODE_650_length_6954_cov_20_000436_g494_i0_p5_ORF_typecomplete_len143_score14_10Pex24p/PF06398_11/0_22Claudin_2/PF13903_6/0_023Claudin_2/PF13903_6/1_6e03LMF1/PF06762_14/1_5DUF1616/PF07760_11/3_6Gaa1/PF04114_14/2_7_NODE_650_length_6954_cov_20_000436_g494_i032293657
MLAGAITVLIILYFFATLPGYPSIRVLACLLTLGLTIFISFNFTLQALLFMTALILCLLATASVLISIATFLGGMSFRTVKRFQMIPAISAEPVQSHSETEVTQPGKSNSCEMPACVCVRVSIYMCVSMIALREHGHICGKQ